MPCYVTHLEGAIDGTQLPAGQIQTLHNDRPIWVRYDLQAVAQALTKDMLRDREPTMWRYRELLPVERESDIVSLGEGMSPMLHCPRLGGAFGLSDVWIKDESQLPTGSFKSRGMAAAITMAKAFGIERIALPSAGNAGGGGSRLRGAGRTRNLRLHARRHTGYQSVRMCVGGRQNFCG